MKSLKSVMLASGAAVALLCPQLAVAEELRMTLWTANEAQLKVFAQIADSFKSTHPDVTVTYESIPFADYIQKLTFQLAGGNPPDLGWLMENAAETFAQAGVLEEIGGKLKADVDYDYADLAPPAMQLWADGEKVYGVPFSTSPFIIFYNKTMFDKAGMDDPFTLASRGEWNIDTFRTSAKAVAEANGAWGFEFNNGEGYSVRTIHALVPTIMAYGGTAWEGSTCRFNSDEAVAAVQLLHDMVFEDKSIVPPGESGDFFSGASAMTMGQIGAVSRLAEAGFEWGVAPLPSGPAGYVPVTGQAAIVVFAQSKQKELATEFLMHLTNKENVALLSTFFPPARQSVLDSDIMTKNIPSVAPEQLAVVKDGIAKGVVLPAHERAPQIQAAMAAPIDALWQRDADVHEALDAVCAAIAPLL